MQFINLSNLLSQSILSLVVPECWLTMRNLFVQCLPNTRHFRAIWAPYCREVSGCFTVFRRYQVIVHARRCHLLGKRYIFCFFAESFNAFFRHDLPYYSSKQWSFPTNVFLSFGLFSSASLVVVKFLDNSVWEWTAWGSTIASLCVQPKYTWSITGVGYSRSISFCRIFTWVHCVAPFQPFLYHPHTPMRKIRASCARKDTLQVGTFLPSFFYYHFFKISYPNKAGQWATT